MVSWKFTNFYHTNQYPIGSVSSVFNFCHLISFPALLLKSSPTLFSTELVLELCEEERGPLHKFYNFW